MTSSAQKVALVTGAARGIGLAAAKRFLADGWRVALLDIEGELLNAAVAALRQPDTTLALTCDVSDADGVTKAMATITNRFGRLDALVNNAGTAVFAPVLETSDADWSRIMAVNLTGPFLCTQHAFRIMKDQTPRGGRIINNGSISAHAPRPFSAAYTSTKHAITGLTKASNLDGRMYDIAVGQVDIGNAATPMTDRMVNGPGVLQPDGTTKHEPRMDAKAVGDAVAYMAGLPLDANVLTMTVMATKMPFVGRG